MFTNGRMSLGMCGLFQSSDPHMQAINWIYIYIYIYMDIFMHQWTNANERYKMRSSNRVHWTVLLFLLHLFHKYPSSPSAVWLPIIDSGRHWLTRIRIYILQLVCLMSWRSGCNGSSDVGFLTSAFWVYKYVILRRIIPKNAWRGEALFGVRGVVRSVLKWRIKWLYCIFNFAS